VATGQGHHPPDRHVVDQLSAYLEGDLKERAAAAVREHLAGCPACERAAGELRVMLASARSLDRPEPPPTLWPAIEGALARDEAPLLAWRRFFVRGFAFGGLAGAAIVVLLVLGWQLVHRPATPALVADDDRAASAVVEATDPLLREAQAEVETAAASYERSISKLRALLAGREEPRWSDDMRARFLERLARLDEAIERSRVAARSAPGDGAGTEILFAAYRSKIDFLAAAVHRGGPEEMPREEVPR
jgi:hypothetical protein